MKYLQNPYIELCLIFISLIICSCSNQETSSGVQIKRLDYPSASAIEYYDGKLYVMGDDATNLLMLDTNLNIIDSILFFSNPERRIPKNVKPDLEASALYTDSNISSLILIGSGSLPHRNWGYWHYLNPQRDILKDSFSFQPLYLQLSKSGIEQVNIEGASFINDENLLLLNRGNKSFPKNHLIVTNGSLWNVPRDFQINIIPIIKEQDSSSFSGISGLCYSKQTDQLIMTVSTEDTRSSYEDGAIGKSYLWMINNISTKLSRKTLSPDRIIDLETINAYYKGQKIESATIIEELKDTMRLVLVADNDDGTSTIFKLSIKKD